MKMNIQEFMADYYDDQWDVGMFWLQSDQGEFTDLIALMCHWQMDKYMVAWINKESTLVSLKRESPAPNFLQGQAMMQDWRKALQTDPQILETQQ